jgi:ribonuclease G
VIKSLETLTYDIFREITRMARQFDATKLLVIAHERVVTRMMEEESASIVELEEFIGKTLSFQVDMQYLPEQFDVVML